MNQYILIVQIVIPKKGVGPRIGFQLGKAKGLSPSLYLDNVITFVHLLLPAISPGGKTSKVSRWKCESLDGKIFSLSQLLTKSSLLMNNRVRISYRAMSFKDECS